MRLLPRRINAQISLLVSVILLTTGVMFGWIIAKKHSERLLATMRENSSVMVRNIAENSARFLILHDYAELESLLIKTAQLPDIRQLQVCEPNGLLIGDVQRERGRKPHTKPGINYATPPRTPGTSIAVEEGRLVVWQPVEAGQLLGWVKATYSMSTIREAYNETMSSVLIVSMIWVACNVAMILIILHPIVQTIGRLSTFARQLDENKGERILIGKQCTEIDELASSLNYASAKLFSTEQQLVGERERLTISEETIRQLNADLSATLQAIPDLLFELGRDGTYLNIWANNPALLARQRETLLGHTVSEMLEPAAAETVMASLREADEKGGSYGKIICLNLADGARWFELSTSKKIDLHSTEGSFIMLSRDITDRKRAEEEMLRSGQRLRLHMEQSPLGFLEWDENFRAIEWNTACERIFGYTREEAIGRHARELILPVEVHNLVDGIYHRLMNQSGGQHSINENVTKDGSIIICEWFNTTLKNKDGKAIGVASICNDITERKRMEEDLRKLNDDLEERVKRRTTQLEEKNAQLERMNKLFVGRELRMVELKERMRVLEEQLDSREV